ncbi:MAG: PAS domain-containing protein [Myxococcales bacterium]|nr:PAS domain-containing protein [Myxococcales bacterium]
MPKPPSRRRERVSDVTTGELHRGDVKQRIAEASAPTPIELGTLASIFQAIAKDGRSDADEEDSLEFHLGVWVRHLRGRRFVVRLLDPETRTLDLVRSTGRLLDPRQERARVTERALERASIDVDAARAAGLTVTQAYTAELEPDALGYDACLVVDGSLLGTVGMEYVPPYLGPASDEDLLDALAAHLAAHLARARVRNEATYLSGYLGRLLDDANVPIAVIDRHRSVQIASAALLTMLGRERSELVGRDFVRLAPKEERARLMGFVREAFRGNTALDSFETGLVRDDGATVRMSAHLVSVLGRDGEIDSVLVIGRDLTELRELEGQVQHAEKLATLGQLAASVVHELNNPLTSISVYSDYLLRKSETDEALAKDREKLERIVQASERVLRFTRDLVAYARPSTEEPSALHLGEVVEQSLGFCEHVIAQAGAKVQTLVEPDLPTVAGVRAQLHQVFVNLVTNACHAMPTGAGRLQVEVRRSGDGVVVRVADNGSGIPSERLERIFEPFYTSKGEGRGTGLGLSIVRKIVQQHGGRIHVKSLLGDGTVFDVWLPTD